MMVSPMNFVPDISSVFRFTAQLGNGASCQVFKALHIANGGVFAVKRMSKSNPSILASFTKESRLLRRLVHPNVVKFHDTFIDKDHFYISSAYASGGTMLDKVMRMKRFSELKASGYIRTLLSAINYIHRLGIAHRDLKCQNIVLDRPGKEGKLLIIDFGESEVLDPAKEYNDFVGTIHYIPPESAGPRSADDLKKGDIWSLGVIAYILLCGTPPFSGENPEAIFRKIVGGKYIYPRGGCGYTKSFKDFVSSLLDVNPKTRVSADVALKHDWILGKCGKSNLLQTSSYLQSLRAYVGHNKLQHILMDAIFNELDDEEPHILDDLDHRLIQEQRRLSKCGTDHVLNFLLLNSWIEDCPQEDSGWKTPRTSEVTEHETSPEISLAEPVLEDLSESRSVICDSPIRNDVLMEHLFLEDSIMSISRIDSAAINGALNFENSLTVPPPLVEATQEAFGLSLDLSLRSILECSEHKSDLQPFLDPADPTDPTDPTTLPPTNPNVLPPLPLKRAATPEEISNYSISVSRFRGILVNSSKEYAVEEIIDDLKDESGHIPLGKIALYTKCPQTIEFDDDDEH